MRLEGIYGSKFKFQAPRQVHQKTLYNLLHTRFILTPDIIRHITVKIILCK